MKIFAIADTHLSGNPPNKPMSVFGDNWADHWEKIKADWREKVTANDTVLLAGDTSWAMKLDEALPDLNEIAELPGRKILIKGNHDYWWQTLGKMTAAVGSKLTFLHNNFVSVGEFAVCGSRGWLCPDDPLFKEADQAVYLREAGRIRSSLALAKAAGHNRFILLLHYPPFYDKPNAFTEIIAEFGVKCCVYGHLHDEAVKTAPTGLIKGTEYFLVSCDALDFKLKQLY